MSKVDPEAAHVAFTWGRPGCAAALAARGREHALASSSLSPWPSWDEAAAEAVLGAFESMAVAFGQPSPDLLPQARFIGGAPAAWLGWLTCAPATDRSLPQ